MKRMAVAALGSFVAVLLVGATSAFATIDGFTIDRNAELTLNETVVILTGLVQCTANDSVGIFASVTQIQGRGLAAGSGNTLIVCTGGVDEWKVIATVVPVDSFKSGPATATVSAFDNTDGDSQIVRTRDRKSVV